MQKALPPLNWLRAFEAASRHLSFTAAARELNMTQSAVSQQIKALERHLQQALFLRRPRRLEMTAAGMTYLPVVQEAFATLARGTRAVSGRRGSALQVQCNLTLAIHWLAPRLVRFQARHPEVRLEIVTDLWEPRAETGGADIEIRYGLAPSGAGVGAAEMLWRGTYYPVAAPGMAPPLEDLPREVLWHCTSLLSTWELWAEEQSLNWPDLRLMHTSTFSVALAVAQSGGGLCLAHDLIAGDLIAEGRLVAPYAHRAEMPEAFYLVTPTRPGESAGVTAFADWLREEIAAPS